jgi:hypothetical protein
VCSVDGPASRAWVGQIRWVADIAALRLRGENLGKGSDMGRSLAGTWRGAEGSRIFRAVGADTAVSSERLADADRGRRGYLDVWTSGCLLGLEGLEGPEGDGCSGRARNWAHSPQAHRSGGEVSRESVMELVCVGKKQQRGLDGLEGGR